MDANNSKMDKLLEIAANNAPITLEHLRALLPVDDIVAPDIIIMYVAISRLGMPQSLMMSISREFEYLKQNLGDKLK